MFAREYAAVSSQSKHLSCIIRGSSESLAAQTGDGIIVCATLAENFDAIWGQEQTRGCSPRIQQPAASYSVRFCLPY
jgi:hypothetical protein